MRCSYLAALSLLLAGAQGAAQDIQKEGTPYHPDFVIPDVPALQLANGGTGGLLHPSTVRDFSVAATNFINDNGDFQLPTSFGVEIAPFLFNNSSLSIEDYQAEYLRYNIRTSIATARDTLGRGSIAFALRLTPIDGADLRLNNEYLTKVTNLTARIVRRAAEMRTTRPNPAYPLTLDSLSADEREQWTSEVEELRRAWEEKRWNAEVLDIALAARARAADSTGRDVEAADYSVWLTYGNGFATWGQYLVGGRALQELDSLGSSYAGNLSGRFTFGSNRYKGLIEVEFTGREGARPVWFLNFGSKVRLLEDLWADFSAGLEWNGEGSGSRPRLITRFELKSALADLIDW